MSSTLGESAPVKILYVDEDYFDLHTILTVNSNVKCTFDNRTPFEFFPLVGQKQPSMISDKGMQAEIPAWMVRAVDYTCQMTIPAAYSATRRDSINASSQDKHFLALQRHYYSLGMHVCKLSGGEDARLIALSLLTAFTQRIEWILRQSLKVTLKPDNMDELERRIFKIGQATEREMLNWIRGIEKQSLKRKHASNFKL